MAVRIVALLIPLAIASPMFQMSRPAISMAEREVTPAQIAPAPEWSYEPRQFADAPSTRVVLESPLQEAVRSMDSPAVDTAVPVVVNPGVRKATVHRAVAQPAQAALPAKRVATAKASIRATPRKGNKSMPSRSGCEPLAHCAPVEVAKVTPVNRQPL
jgi:hypothetical protein